MMNERIRELANNAGVDAGQLFAEMLCTDSEVNVKIAEAWNAQPDEVRQRIFQVIEQNQSKFAELIVRECINCCDEVANEADAMKDSKFVTDAGRMLYEGMWGGATNSAVTIKNRFGVE